MTDHDGGFSLALAFDTDDPEFARGVELGRLWEQLKDGGPIDQSIHATNAEMAIRACEATGRKFSAEPLNDDWIALRVEVGDPYDPDHIEE